MKMAKIIKFAVVAVCLLCILAVCIAPLVDLPATSLRSYQAAAILLWGMIAVAFSLTFSAFRSFAGICITPSDPNRRRREWRIDPLLKLSTVLQC
jgi:nitrate reductase NapE component